MKDFQTAELIMSEYAVNTGLLDLGEHSKRYLWTDAFAVCNFLELYCQTKNEYYKRMALLLVDSVHSSLGHYHDNDKRRGWISGLNDGSEHPTIGGLRIGKTLLERAPGEAYDQRKEWERDGQYFHYLTKWMHALNQVAIVTQEEKYNRWAIELAKTAHKAFTHETRNGKRICWKMSTDLSRPMVTAMGQHDALDAFINYLQLSATAADFGEVSELSRETEEMRMMLRLMPLETEDPLGVSSLLHAASATAQLIAVHGLASEKLLISLLNAAYNGIERFVRGGILEQQVKYRLSFRELGLSIGLHALEIIRNTLKEYPDKFEQKELIAEVLSRFDKYTSLSETIEKFWIHPKNQENGIWGKDIDINNVMLATSLVPNGFLKTSMPNLNVSR